MKETKESVLTGAIIFIIISIVLTVTVAVVNNASNKREIDFVKYRELRKECMENGLSQQYNEILYSDSIITRKEHKLIKQLINEKVKSKFIRDMTIPTSQEPYPLNAHTWEKAEAE